MPRRVMILSMSEALLAKPCRTGNSVNLQFKRGLKDIHYIGVGHKAAVGLPLRQITLVAKQEPHTIAKNKFLADLETHFLNRKLWQSQKQPMGPRHAVNALVILATPGFAGWLEDDAEFLPSVLRLLRNTLPSLDLPNDFDRSSKPEPQPEIDVVCACVDGLVPSPQEFPVVKREHASQGFSILYGLSNQLFNGLWQNDSGRAAHSASSNPPSMAEGVLATALSSNNPHHELKFALHNHGNPSTYITLPLANTLFTNGKPATLVTSRWQAHTDSSFTRIRLNDEKTYQSIRISNDSSVSFNIPAVALTPPRRIASSLGNIVRQIEYAKREPGPASRELEESIGKYLEVTKQPKSTVQVWALITPGNVAHSLSSDAHQVQQGWKSKAHDRGTFIGTWIQKGAMLCRVVSGGGGWGIKQGLLSLDPQTKPYLVTDKSLEDSNGSFEVQQDSALGNLASSGSWIQFFAAHNTTDVNSLVETQTPSILQLTTAFGAVPSTVDDISQPVYAGDNQGGVFHSYPGHFGAVSEAGLYVNQKGTDELSKKESNSTKIDLPYSYVHQDHRQQTFRYVSLD
ncbi:hypothetical protein B0O99DRAFT_18516 [Bisporella sp. PMI_857]|nr:hypothetical protein B0O99DRAFT_18516 [Bisporella sp. PMI_857]